MRNPGQHEGANQDVNMISEKSTEMTLGLNKMREMPMNNRERNAFRQQK